MHALAFCITHRFNNAFDVTVFTQIQANTCNMKAAYEGCLPYNVTISYIWWQISSSYIMNESKAETMKHHRNMREYVNDASKQAERKCNLTQYWSKWHVGCSLKRKVYTAPFKEMKRWYLNIVTVSFSASVQFKNRRRGYCIWDRDIAIRAGAGFKEIFRCAHCVPTSPCTLTSELILKQSWFSFHYKALYNWTHKVESTFSSFIIT